jgi:hypothetical protein
MFLYTTTRGLGNLCKEAFGSAARECSYDDIIRSDLIFKPGIITNQIILVDVNEFSSESEDVYMNKQNKDFEYIYV